MCVCVCVCVCVCLHARARMCVCVCVTHRQSGGELGQTHLSRQRKEERLTDPETERGRRKGARHAIAPTGFLLQREWKRRV